MVNCTCLVSWLLCFVSVSAEFQRFEQPVKPDGSLSFLVVGDWGRKGSFNQTKVAHQMGRVAEELNIDFVVSTGDNFYNDGLASISDPAFEESFSDIYTAKSLEKQWYSVLGNHDYRGNVTAQLSQILQKKDNRWLCQRSFILSTEIADFFFVDTTPFVDKYFKKPSPHKYDWRGVLPRKQYLKGLLEDLELALGEPSTKWKIVVGHHTVRSIGYHGDTEELVKNLLPILQAHEVNMYLNGHDHCLQHIESTKSSLQFFTSGGGSKAWKGKSPYRTCEDNKFYYDGQGFMTLELTRAEAKIRFYDVSGQVLYNLDLSKNQYSAM